MNCKEKDISGVSDSKVLNIFTSVYAVNYISESPR